MKLIKSKDYQGQWELWQEDGMDMVLLSKEELKQLSKILKETKYGKNSSYKTV